MTSAGRRQPPRSVCEEGLCSLADVPKSCSDRAGGEEQDAANDAKESDNDFLLHQEECACKDRDKTDDVSHAVVDHADNHQVVDREENAVGSRCDESHCGQCHENETECGKQQNRQVFARLQAIKQTKHHVLL